MHSPSRGVTLLLQAKLEPVGFRVHSGHAGLGRWPLPEGESPLALRQRSAVQANHKKYDLLDAPYSSC